MHNIERMLKIVRSKVENIMEKKKTKNAGYMHAHFFGLNCFYLPVRVVKNKNL